MIEECLTCEGVGCLDCTGNQHFLEEEEDPLSGDDVTDYFELETFWNTIHKEV